MTRRLLGLTALIVVTTMALAGVASAAVPEKGEPLTKEAWIRKADKICSSANRKLGPLVEEHFGDLGPNERPSSDEIEGYAEDFVGIARKEVAKIKKLVPPAEDKATIKELLSAESDAIDAIDDDPELFISDDNPFEEVSQLARDYGLKVCGSG